MRNLAQYPITTDEVIAYLAQLLEEVLTGELACGDMRPLLLIEAIKLLQGQKESPDRSQG